MRRIPFPAALLAVLPALLWQAAPAAAESDAQWVAGAADASRHAGLTVHREVRSESLPKPKGALVVECGSACGAEVRGRDVDRVSVVARVETQAGSRVEAEALAREVRVVAAGGEVHAEGPAQRHGWRWTVQFRIEVPRRTDLSLAAENGPVAVTGVQGSLRIEALNGPVALEDVGGDVVARVKNGPLAVRLSGPRWEGKGLDAEATNGPVSLKLPPDYSARLEFGTVNGPQVARVALARATRSGRGQRVSVVLGQGGPTVRVVGVNGPAILAGLGEEAE